MNNNDNDIKINKVIAYLCRNNEENKFSSSFENAKAIGLAKASDHIVTALQKHVRTSLSTYYTSSYVRICYDVSYRS